MKHLSIYLTSTLLMILVACGTTSTLPKENVTSLLQSGEFTFMAQRALPNNSDVINVMNSLPASSSSRLLSLDYGYTVQFKDSAVLVELPYFGRMYSPSYDTSKNSYRFTTKDFTLDQTNGKKGSTIYTVLPEDQPNVQKIIMEVFPQGKAFVSIISNDRQGISYDGYIMANEPAKK